MEKCALEEWKIKGIPGNLGAYTCEKYLISPIIDGLDKIFDTNARTLRRPTQRPN